MAIRPLFAVAALALSLAGAAHPVAAADTIADLQTLMRKGEHAQALDMADRLLADNVRDPQLRFLRGVALSELGRSQEAIATFERLTDDFPELPEPYNNLAVLYAQQQQYAKARTALEMAIHVHPAYATAHENLGDVYARLAAQSYERAQQLDASNRSAAAKLSRLRNSGVVPAQTP